MASGEMNTKSVIYTLSDPQTGVVMYVGTTTELPTVRLNGHYATAKSASDPKSIWFKGILDNGQHPLMTVIDECAYDFALQRENYWIAYYRKVNPALLNRFDAAESDIVLSNAEPPLLQIINQGAVRRPGRKSSCVPTLPLQMRLTPEQHEWITSQTKGATDIVRKWIDEAMRKRAKV